MKRWFSLVLAILLFLNSSLAFAEEADTKKNYLDSAGAFLGDTWNSISGAANNAWDWSSDKASDAWNWASENAGIAWDWTSDTASDVWVWTKGAANDAWDWTSDTASEVADWTERAASDAWHWTTGAAQDAWIWSKNTAEDAWSWTCETATNTWTVSSQAISGTWNDLFGEEGKSKGPHHLCVSSPLFANSKLIGDWTDNDSVYTECFSYDGNYDITLIATSRGENILPPSFGEMDFADLVASNY